MNIHQPRPAWGRCNG